MNSSMFTIIHHSKCECSVVILISSSWSRLLAAASVSSLRAFCAWTYFFPFLSLFSLSALLPHRLRRWRHRSLHSARAKYLTILFSFHCRKLFHFAPQSIMGYRCALLLLVQSDYMKSYWTHPAFTFSRALWCCSAFFFCLFFVGYFLNMRLSYSQGQKLHKLTKVFLLFFFFVPSQTPSKFISSLTASVFWKISQECTHFFSLPSQHPWLLLA